MRNRNSNYPKAVTDKSGHGIGLAQVARRLALAYAGKYEWDRGVDEETETYYSKITIYDTDLCATGEVAMAVWRFGKLSKEHAGHHLCGRVGGWVGGR